MKRILLILLLFISVKAFAQYPAPAGVNNFLSSQFFYKISGGDTTVYAKSSNGLWFPMGRASDIVFSTNFQGLGTLARPLDLANSIHLTDTVFAIKGMQIGDTLTFTNRNYDAYQKVGSRGGKASFGYSQLDGGGAYIATRTQNDIAHTRAIYAAQNYTRPTYSDDGGATRHFIPVIDTFIGATLDTLTHTLTVTGGGGVTLAQVDSVKATVETFYNADGALVTSGGYRNVYLSGNEIDFTGSAHNFIVFPSSNLGVGAAPGQSDLGYSLDVFQSGTLGMFQAGNLSVDNAGHAQTATLAAKDSSTAVASTRYVDQAVHAGGFGTGTVTSFSKTDGFGIISSVANPTTTPNHTIRVDSTLVGSKSWAFAAFNTKAQDASTYVPLTRTITINGTTLDLSANRSWTVGSTVTPVSGETPTGLMNGSNVTFTSAHTPIAGSLSIVYNGLILQPTVDYTFSGTTATLVLTGHLSGAPVSTDYLLFNYQY